MGHSCDKIDTVITYSSYQPGRPAVPAVYKEYSASDVFKVGLGTYDGRDDLNGGDLTFYASLMFWI